MLQYIKKKKSSILYYMRLLFLQIIFVYIHLYTSLDDVVLL